MQQHLSSRCAAAAAAAAACRRLHKQCCPACLTLLQASQQAASKPQYELVVSLADFDLSKVRPDWRESLQHLQVAASN